MSSEISFVWDGRPNAAERLADEMLRGIGDPVVETAEDQDDQGRSRTIGAVAARRDGSLLGWAEVCEDPEGDRAAHVQGLYGPRMARRIRTGHYDRLPPNDEEFEVFLGLYRHAAQGAGDCGYRTLRFSGMDTGVDGRAATELNADVRREYAREWSAERATWQSPAGLPDVPVRQRPGPGLTLAMPDAEVSLRFDECGTYVNAGEAIHHHTTDPRVLAALLAHLLTRLRSDHPDVTELTIGEFDDEVVRRALPLAGLRIRARFMEYELPLTPT
ncbi:hypothetical protein [Streptomyces yunnanensis]|uniref:Uncharacterized protein n=1 Tax=Streptomyces yunnanensis TaxID=156453 RepID=A0A9X8N9Q3_9ACTN|nr:hypothetical protein [Streptomyces yunnanensis]SHN34970.1 hypothetical protein SAMN05216268_15010 [Streptomyces yunnanensis]